MKPEFFRDRIALLQSEALFRLGTDAMVLADFARIPRGAAVCDLCAGTGAVGLLLSAEDPARRVTAVELQEAPCGLLRQAVDRNGLKDRFTVICGDLREHRSLFAPGSFRCVVCNPPYYPEGAGFAAESEAVAIAKTERCCTLEDVAAASDWLLQTGGSLDLVHKPERLTDLLCTLRAHGLEPKRLRLVVHKPEAKPSLVLLRAVKGGKPGLDLQHPLILQNPDGTPSAEYRRIYHIPQEGPDRGPSCSPEVSL